MPRDLSTMAMVVAMVCAGAQVSAQDGARLDGLIHEAVQRYAAAVPEAPAGATRTLTLDEATAIALSRNLDIVVQRASPETYDLQLAGLKAGYLPTVTSLLGSLRQVATPTTSLIGGQRVTTTTSTFNAALGENLPWGGGRVQVNWENDRVATNNFLYNFNPAFNTTLRAQVAQPLLRGLHTDSLRQQLAVAKANRDISDAQLKQTVTNTVAAVRNAYWDLVFAIDSIQVAQKSVALAHQLVEENRKRVEYGTLTRLDVLTSESQEATSRHALVNAEGDRRTAEIALKRLLVAGRDDALWQAVLDPIDRPAETAQVIDVEAAIRRALADRTDLVQAKRQEAANQATLSYLRDQARPQADLVATYALAGVGGTQLLRGGNDPAAIFTGPVIGRIPGGFADALGGLSRARYPTWGVSLNVGYPIGFSQARAEAARAKVQERQVEAEIRQIEVQVVTEVTNAAIQVRNSFDAVQSAKVARDVARQRLDAEEKKYAAGVSTNYQLVQVQRDLADAENTALRAEVTYRKALVEFERAQQTTLQASGVTIVSPAVVSPGTGSGVPASPAPSGAFIQ